VVSNRFGKHYIFFSFNLFWPKKIAYTLKDYLNSKKNSANTGDAEFLIIM